MKHARILFNLLILSLFALGAHAQKNHTADADAAYNNYSFHHAIDLYKKAYSKEKKAAEKKRILYHIGMSYYQLQDNKNAENWLKKAIKAGHKDSESYYFLGDAIRRQGRFDEALVEFKKYKDKAPTDPRAKQSIEACQLAQEWKDKPTRYAVEPEALLNSKQYDFSPSWADKKNSSLLLTSTREGSIGNEIDPNTGEGFSSIWYTKRDKKGKWSVPVLLGETVNMSESNEGSASMNARKNQVFFTRCVMQKKKTLGCEIYTARKAGKNWGEATLIQIEKDDSITVGHPVLAFGDQYLFFASDLPGGYGGKDIWYSKYVKKGKTWSKPVNLGKEINTAGDEMFPFIREDGTLYFASNGHPGMGGLDIFKAARQGKEDKWAKVENMKYPINSESNDFGIIFDGKKERGFFTTDREGGRGGDDIWSFRIPPLKFIIDGAVSDVETNDPIKNATIVLKGTDGTSVEIKTDELGFFEFDAKDGSTERYILENTSYTMEVSKEGYLKGKGQETTVGVEKSTRFKHDFKLQSIKTKEIKFPEVRYDLAKWELQVNEQVNSKDSLNYLYQTLIDNPTIVIELMAHTDTRGRDNANLTLSQKRAQSCVDYLVSKGIAADRMVARGYGESEPNISDAEIAKLATKEEKEAAHQKNRRTTFKVIRDDYVPKAPEKKEGEEGASSENKPATEEGK